MMRGCQWAGDTARLLFDWLAVRLDTAVLTWLLERCERLGGGEREILPAVFSAVPHKTGKRDLALSAVESQAAQSLHPGWSPERWSVDQAVRACFLLASCRDAGAAGSTVGSLLANADLGETVAVYRSLAVLPFAEVYRETALEGLRATARPVFDAIALHNPYPRQHLDEESWNRMVLKALALDRPLEGIVGLRERANRRLAEALLALQAERRAAGRPPPHGLASLVGPFVEEPPSAPVPLPQLEAPGDVGC